MMGIASGLITSQVATRRMVFLTQCPLSLRQAQSICVFVFSLFDDFHVAAKSIAAKIDHELRTKNAKRPSGPFPSIPAWPGILG